MDLGPKPSTAMQQKLERITLVIEYIALRLSRDEDQKGKILELLHGTPYVPFERNDGG